MTWVTTQVCLSGVIVFVVKVARCLARAPINTTLIRRGTAAKAPKGITHAATALISQVA